MKRPLPLPLKIYARVATLLAPFAPRILEKRARRGKEDRDRMTERFGVASRPRPEGRLVWMHGASVGETISLLPVIESFTQRGVHVMVTSGTVTSAAVMEKRLPAGAFHQFVPLDAPPFAKKFLAHWQPDCALFAESEIWPNLLIEAHGRDIPVMMINGRMSERSYQRWRKTPAIIRALLSRVDLCMAQSSDDAFRYGALGARNVQMPGNLKYDVPAPPADAVKLAALSGSVAGRPVWLAASTHHGEDAIILDAHQTMVQRLPDLLTMIVPRHPERGADIMALIQARGLKAAQRSANAAPAAGDGLYVADTIGEMGLFYRLAPLVFMGGSFIVHGGQNPIEPAKLGAAVLHGPHVFNFTDAFALLDKAGGSLAVENAESLAQTVEQLLLAPAHLRDMGQRAHTVIAGESGATGRSMQLIADTLAARAQEREDQAREIQAQEIQAQEIQGSESQDSETKRGGA